MLPKLLEFLEQIYVQYIYIYIYNLTPTVHVRNWHMKSNRNSQYHVFIFIAVLQNGDDVCRQGKGLPHS